MTQPFLTDFFDWIFAAQKTRRFQDIVQHLGLTKSTVHNHLHVLRAVGIYVNMLKAQL